MTTSNYSTLRSERTIACARATYVQSHAIKKLAADPIGGVVWLGYEIKKTKNNLSPSFFFRTVKRLEAYTIEAWRIITDRGTSNDAQIGYREPSE